MGITNTLVVVGAQWGDEGKGKVVDLIGDRADAVVRYQGGDNAGHTVVVGSTKHMLRLIPSAVLNPRAVLCLGSGVVINPTTLLAEAESLEEQGLSVWNRLYIDYRAGLILPIHQFIDSQQEEALGADRIGTTQTGTTPAYTSRIGRIGLRMEDIFDPNFNSKVWKLTNYLWRAHHVPAPHPDVRENTYRFLEDVQRVLDTRVQIQDVGHLIEKKVVARDNVLFEGAQGIMLDVDHGYYPYVTSSHPVAGYAAVGSGVGPQLINQVIGVVKAYSTRIGAGPFLTEMAELNGDYYRAKGNEYGTVTGRPRRMGWLDLVALHHTVRTGGITHLAVTKCDVMQGETVVPICLDYRDGNRVYKDTLPIRSVVERCIPTYGMLKREDIDDLPRALPRMLRNELCIPVVCSGTGPSRGEVEWVDPGSLSAEWQPKGY